MGSKHRLKCKACGCAHRDLGPKQERCPRCDALIGPRERIEKKKRPSPRNPDARELHSLLDDAVLIDAFGERFEAALLALAASPLPLCLDAEGVALSRTGALTLLQLAAESCCFLFDVQTLGAACFGRGGAGHTLRSLLEDPLRLKCCWDVRRDSDALLHQFNVAVAGVLDTQLLAVALRRASGATVTRLPGLSQSAAAHLPPGLLAGAAALKSTIADCYSDTPAFWAQRPLSQNALRYAAADAVLTRRLHVALLEAAEPALLARVQAASDNRVREWRDAAEAVPQRQCAEDRVAPLF